MLFFIEFTLLSATPLLMQDFKTKGIYGQDIIKSIEFGTDN